MRDKRRTIANPKQLCKVFFRWLKEEGLYGIYQYEYDHVRYNKSSLVSNIEHQLNYESLMSIAYGLLLSYSFIWSFTKNGNNFWRKKNHIWEEYLQTNFLVL